MRKLTLLHCECIVTFDNTVAGCLGCLFAQHQLSKEISIMMTTKRLDNFEVVCEWDSCSFKGHSMEELSDHMSQHLKDYLGDNDALEELGE